jgi:hypothetical protein
VDLCGPGNSPERRKADCSAAVAAASDARLRCWAAGPLLSPRLLSPRCVAEFSRTRSRRRRWRGAASGAPRAGLWPWKAPPGAPAPSPPRQGATDLPGFIYVPADTAGSRLPRAPIIPVAAAASRTLRVAARSAFADPGPTGRSTGTGSYQEDGDRLGLSPGPGHVLATGFGTCEGKGRTSRPGRTGTRATRAARLEWPDATPRSRDAILPANFDSGPRARGGGMRCGPDVRERPL